MSEKPAAHAEPHAQAEAAPKKGGGMLAKLAIGLFVGAVILVECAIFYLMVPSADAIAAKAEAKLAEKLQAEKASSASTEGGSEGERGEGDSTKHEHGSSDSETVVEVELGHYMITAQQPTSNSTIRVDFNLFATVDEEEKSEFGEHFEKSLHRLRDIVIFEIRNAQISDLADPGLGLIKRRILEKSNALFGKHLLHEIVFSDFSLFEQ